MNSHKIFSLILVGILVVSLIGFAGAAKADFKNSRVSLKAFDNRGIDQKLTEDFEDKMTYRFLEQMPLADNVVIFSFPRASDEELREIAYEIGMDKVKRAYNQQLIAQMSKQELYNFMNKYSDKIYDIQPDYILQLHLDQNVPLIGADSVWAMSLNGGTPVTGEGEVVAVIDTGVDFLPSPLTSKNALVGMSNVNCTGTSFILGIGCNIISSHMSIGEFPHGTHVAGIVAASGFVNGVGKDVKIIGIDIDGYNQAMSSSDLNTAIDWIVANKDVYNISVISMSLGFSTLFSDVISCENSFGNFHSIKTSLNDAVNAGLINVASSGNDASGTGIVAPACLSSVIAVSNTDNNDVRYSTGNYASGMMRLFAPGVGVDSIVGKDILASATGTSMSAPHVSGSIALLLQAMKLNGMWQNNPPSQAEIEDFLYRTGRNVTGTTADSEFARIHIGDAVQELMPAVCADIVENGNVDVSDLLNLLANWGVPENPLMLDGSADLNRDGLVSVTDLLQLLSEWGTCGAKSTLSYEQGEDLIRSLDLSEEEEAEALEEWRNMKSLESVELGNTAR